MAQDIKPSLLRFWPALLVAAILLASGSFHLLKFLVDGSDWSGPLSVRKPTLFGISGGLTVWSMAWLMTQVRSRKFDFAMANAFALALLVEVALITMQYWRGVGSHFNRSTPIDATVEAFMLGLILIATSIIVHLTVRAFDLRAIDPSMAIAIQGGMLLLALSCGLGMLTTVLGEVSSRMGGSNEVWGHAGVLKFPHGAAVHAIQLLPLVAWITNRLGLRESVRWIQAALASQVCFLAYAAWQTIQGRDRFDWDFVGGLLLATTALLGLAPGLAIVWGVSASIGKRIRSTASQNQLGR